MPESLPEDTNAPQETQGRRAAGALLLCAIAVCAICSVARTFRTVQPLRHFTVRPWQEAADDRFSEMGRRYLPLRQHLMGLPIVGFISSYDHEMGHRMMAQSLSAPTLVVDSDEPAVVIASFESEARLDEYLARKAFRVSQRLGNGLAILRRESK